jgi:hypothetical protein
VSLPSLALLDTEDAMLTPIAYGLAIALGLLVLLSAALLFAS